MSDVLGDLEEQLITQMMDDSFCAHTVYQTAKTHHETRTALVKEQLDYAHELTTGEVLMVLIELEPQHAKALMVRIGQLYLVSQGSLQAHLALVLKELKGDFGQRLSDLVLL